jgi:hypothetical protein
MAMGDELTTLSSAACQLPVTMYMKFHCLSMAPPRSTDTVTLAYERKRLLVLASPVPSPGVTAAAEAALERAPRALQDPSGSIDVSVMTLTGSNLLGGYRASKHVR